MPKKILIAIVPEMLKKVDTIAVAEHRTRSDLMREALRSYIEQHQLKQIQLGKIPNAAL